VRLAAIESKDLTKHAAEQEAALRPQVFAAKILDGQEEH
jgi:hypothetical protein